MTRKSKLDGLRISANGSLVLPPAIVGMRMPVFAEPGAGKSVFLAVLMEELWRLGLQFVALDPLGTGWGIKASADGLSAGIPLPYLGGKGRYADAPLRPDGGAIVARALASTGVSMMLNVSAFSREEQNRFVADLWNEMLLIAGDRHEAGEPLSILNLVDEASFFMPETPRGVQQARAQDAGERVARQGRGLGLGFVTPTQRGQALDKDVVGMWEVFVLMRLTERRAIDAAIREFGHLIGDEQVKEIRNSLPRLADGEAWIVSPRALGIVQRVQLRMRETYDSTRTPAPGERRRAPTSLAQADLTALRAALAAPADDDEPAKTPAKRGLLIPAGTTLDLSHDARGRATVGAARIAALENDKKMLEKERDALAAKLAQLENDRAVLTQASEEIARTLRAFGAKLPELADRVDAIANRRSTVERSVRAAAPSEKKAALPTPSKPTAVPAIDGVRLKDGAYRMLAMLAAVAMPLTRRDLGVLANVVAPTTLSEYVSALKAHKFVVEEGKMVSLTASGRTAAGKNPLALPSSQQLVEMHGRSLKSGAVRMLELAIAMNGKPLKRKVLGAQANITAPTTLSEYVSSLRRRGLVIEGSDGVKASPIVFIARGR